jgi:hypothetical protein
VLVAEIAQMPRPQESLRKNEKSGSDDGEPDARGRVPKVISGAQEKYQNDVAHPTQGNEGLDQRGAPSSSTRIAAVIASTRKAKQTCALRRTGRMASFILEATFSEIYAAI